MPTTYAFTVPAARPDDTPRLDFTVNDEPFRLLMPKLTIAVGLLAVMEREDSLSRTEYGIEIARAMWGLIDYVEKEPPEPMTLPNPDWADGAGPEVPERIDNPHAGRPRGQARLRQRLNDPNDGMDVDDLAPLLAQMLSVMFNRPTGPPPESSPAPGGGGSASEAPTPATPAETS